jgi:hypothetical protein
MVRHSVAVFKADQSISSYNFTRSRLVYIFSQIRSFQTSVGPLPPTLTLLFVASSQSSSVSPMEQASVTDTIYYQTKQCPLHDVVETSYCAL